MNLQEFLIVSPDENVGTQTDVNYKVTIEKVKDNPYYIEFGDKPTHWLLRIDIQTRWNDEPNEFEDTGDYVEFRMSRYSLKPTMEEFSKHIYDECRNTLEALDFHKPEFVSDSNKWMMERTEITPANVYKFMKLLHKDYTNTESFLKDYDTYLERIYHNMKFIYKLINGWDAMWSRDFKIPIGENFMAFLDLHTVKNYRTWKFS
jgi:hypothetical protein